MKHLRTIIASLCFLAVVTSPGRIAAHILVTDTTHQTGAVLHLSPDDDPIAGEPTNIFFDIQDKKVSASSYSYRLSVTDKAGQVTLIPIANPDNFVSGGFVFPSQGIYKLALDLTPRNNSDKPIHFVQTQRVSRGIPLDNTSNPPKHKLVMIGLVVSLATISLLGILIVNNKRLIINRKRLTE